MNKAIVVAVVFGGLALGGVFFIAGIFTGISVSLREERTLSQSSEGNWPPPNLKAPSRLSVNTTPSAVSTSESGKSASQGLLASQEKQVEDGMLLRAEDKPQVGIEKLFEKVPETPATAPFADALKGAAQASVAQQESAAVSAAKAQKSTGDTPPTKTSSSSDQKTVSPSADSSKNPNDKNTMSSPRNLQLDESSPVLVTKPDKLVPSAEELFDELARDERQALPSIDDPLAKSSVPVFVVVGTLAYEDMVQISALLKGHGYKVFTRRVPSPKGQKFLVLSGPFRERENPKQLLGWLRRNDFKTAKLMTLKQLKEQY
jgi:cell division septation protein DedD